MSKQNGYRELDNLVHELSQEKDREKSLDIAVLVANEFMRILFPDDARGERWSEALLEGEDLLDNVMPVSNFPNQKVESWFEKHPYIGGERTALRHFQEEDAPVESHFYWLNKSSAKSRITAGVMLTPNWEDSDLTKFPDYKVGIDFFMTADGSALLVVLSKEGNLRVLELSERLSNTQIDILGKIDGAAGLTAPDDEPSQGIVHQTLWDAFALKEVNKHFYEGIAEHFQSLLSYMQEHSDKSEEDIKLFANRLIGRLLFIWFLRKKKFINEEIGYFDCEETTASDYYENKLKPLFFNTLNKVQDERVEIDGIRDEYTPFLNGGLFEPNKTTDWVNECIDFPSDWFRSLYSHFDEFNFTTDESTPEYEQVAIDPEMLGRVFENLLASQLDETGQEARKASGSFYTPREIVSYMCKEALRQYLYIKLDNESLNEGIDDLLDKPDQYFEESHSNAKRELWGLDRRDEVVEKVLAALDEIQILDPACGSGAFPMGMLQLLIKTYTRLGYKPKSYDLKLQILENNIYGVDIQPMAAEIARLRAWLSIIVDEEDANNVRPLPNLDFKFVCANTLVPLEEPEIEQGSFWEDENVAAEEKLDGLRHIYFQETEPHEKEQTRVEYHEVMDDGSGADSKRMGQIRKWDPFTLMKPAPFFDPDKMFGVRDGFDLLIGNPPYIHMESIKDLSASLYEPLNYQTYAKRGDMYALFYERGFELLHEDGVLCYITSNKWMRAAYGKSLRNFFLEKTNPVRLIDFAGTSVFESATVDVNIFLATKGKNQGNARGTIIRENCQDNLSDYVKQNSTAAAFSPDESWAILSDIEKSIKEKIETAGVPLKDWDIDINYGIKTGCNDAFIIDNKTKNRLVKEDPHSAEIIRPILRGKDIKRYEYSYADRWLITTHNGYNSGNETIPAIDIEEYPAVKAHLDLFWDEIKERGDKGRTPYNLRDCAYMDDFSKQKIIWGEFSAVPNFALCEEAIFFPNNVSFITGSDLKYILAFLNSSLALYHMHKTASYGMGSFKWYQIFVKEIPIADATPERKSKIEALVETALETHKGFQEIDKEIYRIFDFTDEEVAAIESEWTKL